MSRKYSSFQHIEEGRRSNHLDVKRKSSAAVVADILERSDNDGDLGKIYYEDNSDEDENDVFANIKIQMEVVNSVKYQPWTMAKKLKLQRLAKTFVLKHEGMLSKGHGYQEKGAKIWKVIKREISNIYSLLTPWEMRVKEIESHFGSVVASYFLFLRWLIWINVWLTLIPVCFVLIPEIAVGESYGSSARKSIPEDQRETSSDLKTIWDAEGILKYSPIFYGYYGDSYFIGNGYRLPLAYLLTGFTAFAFSFIVVLRKMAANSSQSRLANKDEQFTFSWRLFSSWDYMIGNVDTATNKVASIVTNIKELILEEKEKQKSAERRQLILLRILANICVVILLALSTYIIQLCVERSRKVDLRKRKEHFSINFWDQNELTVVMTLISTIFPTLFDIVSIMEKYHPRTNLRWQLARIFMLNLLNLYTLFIALFWKQQDLVKEIENLVQNATDIDCGDFRNHTSNITLITSQIKSSPGYNEFPFTNLTVDVVSTTPASSDIGSSNFTTNWATKSEEISRKNSNCTLSGKTDLSRDICWETMIGQEVFKLTVMDLVFVLGTIIIQDFLRGLFVRYCNIICCWDLEKTFPEYGDFKTPENILHLINNQGVIWLGTFFAPGLPVLNLVKLLILVYVRCWSVMVCNVPQDVIFRASKSNNFYYALLLIMLFLSMLPPLFAIVTVEPSPDCGPFSGRKKMFHILTETIDTELPPLASSILEYIASPGVIIPVFMLLGMTIYYLVSVSRALKEANSELKNELNYERSEGKRRIYAMADAKRNLEQSEHGKSPKKIKRGGLTSAARIAKMLSKPSKTSQQKQNPEEETGRVKQEVAKHRSSHPEASSVSVSKASELLRKAIVKRKMKLLDRQSVQSETKAEINTVIPSMNTVNTAVSNQQITTNTESTLMNALNRPINIQISGLDVDHSIEVPRQKIDLSTLIRKITTPKLISTVGTQTYFHVEDENQSQDNLSTIQKYKIALHKKRKNQRHLPHYKTKNIDSAVVYDGYLNGARMYESADEYSNSKESRSEIAPCDLPGRGVEIQMMPEDMKYVIRGRNTPDEGYRRENKPSAMRRYSMQLTSSRRKMYGESNRRSSFPSNPEICINEIPSDNINAFSGND